MLTRIIMCMIVYVMFIIIQPALETFDFSKGFNEENVRSWSDEYIMPNYDMTKITQVNSEQTQDVTYTLGEPFEEDGSVTLDSEYQGTFHVYDDPGVFRMVLTNDGSVTGVYTNSDDVSVGQMNFEGLDRLKVEEIYGEPVSTISKGMQRLVVENDEYDVFDLEDSYVYFFYDLHENDEVSGMLVIDKDELDVNNVLYNNPDAEEYEQMNWYMLNAARIEYGLEPLEIDGEVSAVAKSHSTDMAEREYFDHDSPEGSTLKDRVEDADIRYRLAGENIATGHTSPIFSHHSLMNSLDHRVNILNADYTHIGLGVDYSDEDVPYYTENFIER
ncbi:CAP domain-containing protein [Corticicoccus populi]|uniref:CAP domain-containing protein n=1 Tax=Corticicoccus populi TaxID=1812821 RepID=A0ABW5WSY4_9STAP